jgi:hypothetical protein
MIIKFGRMVLRLLLVSLSLISARLQCEVAVPHYNYRAFLTTS